jgi:hypothetical protein
MKRLSNVQLQAQLLRPLAVSFNRMTEPKMLIVGALVVLTLTGCSERTNQSAGSSSNSAPTNPKANQSETRAEEVLPAGAIVFPGSELVQVMPIYAYLSETVIDTNQLAELPPAIIRFRLTNAVTRSEAIRLLDKALFEQAGIVVTHPDARHIRLVPRAIGVRR